MISVHIGDRVSIRCPKSDETGKYEYSYIYMVSDEEYDHCFLSKPRLVGACDNQTINVSEYFKNLIIGFVKFCFMLFKKNHFLSKTLTFLNY